jgi:asparagine synthase (glutamine-hydrolysing)
MPSLADFAPTMEHPFGSALSNRAWQDLTRETLPCCLRAESRTMAAVGMERFHPFLDHRLVELMLPLRGDLKIRAGTTKQLLREAMRGVLPEATRTRVAKTGWNAPAHRWFTGAGREALMDLVRSRPFRERGVYDPAEVERLAAEHEEIVLSGEPRDNHMMFLWQVLNVELWLRDLEGAGT